MLDEIQEVGSIPNPWLKDENATIGFVDILLGLLDFKNVDIYVTGSNSKMLSADVMTEFWDRGDEIHVNPLMYKEFYSALQGEKHHAWQEFVTYGGLSRAYSVREMLGRCAQNHTKNKLLLSIVLFGPYFFRTIKSKRGPKQTTP